MPGCDRDDEEDELSSVYLPTMKQLQYLVALHDHGGFSRAAEAMSVSQSTLSGGINELESLIGMTIVERTKRMVRFTETGEQVVRKARTILKEARELTDTVRAARMPLSGEMRMGVIPTIAPFILPKIVPRLKKAYPDLRMYLREETSADACSNLQEGRSDCVLLAFPFACGDVEKQALFEDPMYVAYHDGEALGDGDTVIPSVIDGRNLLLLEDGHCFKDHVLGACNRPDLRDDAQMMGTSLHTMVQMVDGGLGITMLPGMAVDAGILKGTDVRAKRLEAQHASRTIALVWRKGSPRERDFRLLADFIADVHRDQN